VKIKLFPTKLVKRNDSQLTKHLDRQLKCREISCIRPLKMHKALKDVDLDGLYLYIDDCTNSSHIKNPTVPMIICTNQTFWSCSINIRACIALSSWNNFSSTRNG
jgi:hypothetical protein